MRLDRSDRILMEQEVEAIINSLMRLQAVGDAQCSVVLEMYEHMGGRVRTCTVPK